MTHDIRAALISSAIALATVVAMVANPAGQTAPPSGEGLPDAPGKDVTARMCGLCHEARRAASVRLTYEGWSAVIDGMIKRGAKGTDQEIAVVLDYLSTHFLGEASQPVNVNTAQQIDLELVAGLLRREAAAVVQYREKNGPFKTLDDMKKVPGLDFKKIDSKRDFIIAM